MHATDHHFTLPKEQRNAAYAANMKKRYEHHVAMLDQPWSRR